MKPKKKKTMDYKTHTDGCPSLTGGECNCGAGWRENAVRLLTDVQKGTQVEFTESELAALEVLKAHGYVEKPADSYAVTTRGEETLAEVKKPG